MKVWIKIKEHLEAARNGFAEKHGIDPAELQIRIEQPKFENQGDFACPVAMGLAKKLRKSPLVIAREFAEFIPEFTDTIERVEVVPPGYINFFVNQQVWFDQLEAVLADPKGFLRSNAGQGQRVLLEFVSANPTGPLHVGHARGAILGDALARIMSIAGYNVETEYYLNDRGNQISALGRSLYARGRELLGQEATMPENGYKGSYLIDIAKRIIDSKDEIVFRLPYDTTKPPDETFLSLEASRVLKEGIKGDLAALGIEFDHWFSEQDMVSRGSIDHVLGRLQGQGLLYKTDDGAMWFRSTNFGDDQDRVVIRSNGMSTYFASDIAYHDEKFRRGYDTLINIWGADHHGYIPRVHAAMQALGYNPKDLEVLLVQMVSLVKNGRPVTMGKRSGDYYTLRDLVNEVGKDAVRFIFLTRKADAQMEFDIDRAKARSMDNPVYYVQYGHARLRSILTKAGVGIDQVGFNPRVAGMLGYPEEKTIIKKIVMFPFTIEQAAITRQPHLMVFTLMDLVKTFHSYYTRYKGTDKVLSDDPKKREARLIMTAALARVIHYGLDLVGVDAPEVMSREE